MPNIDFSYPQRCGGHDQDLFTEMEGAQLAPLLRLRSPSALDDIISLSAGVQCLYGPDWELL